MFHCSKFLVLLIPCSRSLLSAVLGVTPRAGIYWASDSGNADPHIWPGSSATRSPREWEGQDEGSGRHYPQNSQTYEIRRHATHGPYYYIQRITLRIFQCRLVQSE